MHAKYLKLEWTIITLRSWACKDFDAEYGCTIAWESRVRSIGYQSTNSIQSEYTWDKGDVDLGDDVDEQHINNIILANQNQQQWARGWHQTSMNFNLDDEDKADIYRVIASRVIILPPLAPRENFNITSTMIQLLTLKGLFVEMANDDLNTHLINFIGICKSFDFPIIS